MKQLLKVMFQNSSDIFGVYYDEYEHIENAHVRNRPTGIKGAQSKKYAESENFVHTEIEARIPQPIVFPRITRRRKLLTTLKLAGYGA